MIWDYPITFPYGATSAPYSSTNPHKGEDRAAPKGTQVPVNGVLIGTVGTTGFSTGNHLHVQKFSLATGNRVHPRGGGKTLPNAVVTHVDTEGATGKGKFVRVRSGSYDWEYLHLDTIKVKVGEKLGEDMTTKSTAIMLVRTLTHEHNPPEKVWKNWVGLNDKQLKARLDNVYKSDWFKAQTVAIKNSESSKFKVLAEKVKALIPFTK